MWQARAACIANNNERWMRREEKSEYLQNMILSQCLYVPSLAYAVRANK